MRTLQAVLPRPQALKHSRVPLGFMVEVRRLLCRAILAKQALRMYQLSAQELQTLPVCKVAPPSAHCCVLQSWRPHNSWPHPLLRLSDGLEKQALASFWRLRTQVQVCSTYPAPSPWLGMLTIPFLDGKGANHGLSWACMQRVACTN